MELQGETVGVPEEGVGPLGVGVHADGLADDALFLQLGCRLPDIVHPEGQMPQAQGLRLGGPGGGAGDGKDLQLPVSKPQVQLPVPLVGAIVVPQNGQAKLFHVKFLGLLVVGHDDGHMVHTVKCHEACSFASFSCFSSSSTRRVSSSRRLRVGFSTLVWSTSSA